MNSARSAEALQDQHKAEPHFKINKHKIHYPAMGKSDEETNMGQTEVKIGRAHV